MRQKSISQAQLARKLGLDAKQVQRVVNLRHASTHSQLEAALEALGLRANVVIESEPA